MKIFPFKAGNTLDCDQRFIRKLTKKGAKVVDSIEKSDAIIVFCPIVSRFETDIKSALSSLPAESSHGRKLILVAMHPTFDEDYTLPKHRVQDNRAVELLVDCLFFETKGLYKCPRNKMAIKTVCNTLHLTGSPAWCISWRRHGDKVKKEKKSKNEVVPNESGELGDEK